MLYEETTLPSGHFLVQQIIAIVLLGLVVLGAEGLVRRRAATRRGGGLLTGADNRYSTGRLIAMSWAILVAWMLVTDALIAAVSGVALTDVLANASQLYFVLLGGPWAAAAFALLSTQTKVSQGTLAKPSAENPQVGDFIADDNGNVDTYDFQYTLFNLIALFIVLLSFIWHPGHGLPDIPQFLAILTGGSALTYTVNKAMASSGPQILNVDPTQARVGDFILITGSQLFSAQAGSPLPKVAIGSVGAVSVAAVPGAPDTLTVQIPPAPAAVADMDGQQDVTVTPDGKGPITVKAGVTVVADVPKIATAPERFTSQADLAVKGVWLLEPGKPSGSLAAAAPQIGTLVATLVLDNGSAFPVQFTGVYSNTAVTLSVGTQPADPGGQPGEDRPAHLTLTRGTVTTKPFDLTYRIS